MTFKHIERLLDDEGTITVGPVGPYECAAVGADDHNMLAALVREEGESFMELLGRLYRALEDALDLDLFVDELNG